MFYKVITQDERADGHAWLVPVSWTKVYMDFDSDSETYTPWLVAPIALVGYWWSEKRWLIERWLRWRIADIPGGISCTLWRLGLRPIEEWTIKRTRPHTTSQAYKDLCAGWDEAIRLWNEGEKEAAMSAVRNYIHNV